MATETKSSLLRKTADEFDELMAKFDRTKQDLVEALTKAQLRDEAIAQHVRAFDEGKRIIEELFPIRNDVEAIKNSIVEPVAKVISDSSDTNKRFAVAGLTFGALSILASLIVPHLPFADNSSETKKLSAELGEIKGLLQPAAAERALVDTTLLLYDRFETANAPFYEIPRLLTAGDVGRSHGYESVGIQPSSDLIYRAVEVPCASGCRLSFEAMVKLDESIDISSKEIKAKTFTPVSPIELRYSTAHDPSWKILEPVQSAILVEWLGKKNKWQSIKTPYQVVPATLRVTKIRITLRRYQWKRLEGASDKSVQCATDFDEIKLFAAALEPT